MKIKLLRHRNKKTSIGKISFDSIVESRRYIELQLLQRAKKISGLQLQPVYLLQPAFKCHGKSIRKMEYIGDFCYVNKDGETIVEDVKSDYTQKDPVYRLKRKLMLYKYPNIVFKEVIY